MDKILLREGDTEFILDWRDKHLDLVRKYECPMSAVQIVSLVNGAEIKGFRKGSQLKLYLYDTNKKQLGHIVFEVLHTGYLRKIKDTTKVSEDLKQSALTIYGSLMAFVRCWRETDYIPKSEMSKKTKLSPSQSTTPKKQKKSRSKPGITYIIKQDSGGRIIKQGSRSGPSCEFSVRGHYRHMRDGRVIWISEYVKGKGKGKNKRRNIMLKKDTPKDKKD